MSSSNTYDVIIVGCGVFGLSTAIHLAKKGARVVALDAFPVPSPLSAANDYNKIIRIEYPDPLYMKLAVDALAKWETDPLYSKNFYKVGRLTLSPLQQDDESIGRLNYEKKSLENIEKFGIKQNIIKINNPDDLSNLIPEFKSNALPDTISAAYNKNAGFAHSANSLRSAYEEAVRLGVTFRTGKSGHVIKVDDGEVLCESGDLYYGSKVLISMGAATGNLIDLQGQIKATGIFVTHIQLTEEESKKYRNLPIFFSAELGYFFPPDKETNVFKFVLTSCDAKNTITNPFNPEESISLPRYKTQFESDTIPEHTIEDAKQTLNLLLPELADKPLTDCKVCWLSDTTDSHFLIDKVPFFGNVYVACGDSGHGFKFLPNIGKYISQVLDGTIDADIKKSWSWKRYPTWKRGVSSRVTRPNHEMKDINWYIE